MIAIIAEPWGENDTGNEEDKNNCHLIEFYTSDNIDCRVFRENQ